MAKHDPYRRIRFSLEFATGGTEDAGGEIMELVGTMLNALTGATVSVNGEPSAEFLGADYDSHGELFISTDDGDEIVEQYLIDYRESLDLKTIVIESVQE